MFLLKLLGIIFGLFLLYALFLLVCSLFVNPKKEYEEHSSFYRALLNGATAVAIKLMRIRIHTSGMEKVPENTKKLLFVSNHCSNFDPIITWHIFKKSAVILFTTRQCIDKNHRHILDSGFAYADTACFCEIQVCTV